MTTATSAVAAWLGLALALSACGERREAPNPGTATNQVPDDVIRAVIEEASKMGAAAGPAPEDVIAIIRAIDAGDAPKLRKLLEEGAAPTPKGSPLSPLHAAITHFRSGKLICDYEALKLLLDHQADPNFVDEDSGFTALEDALSMGDIPCATLLKERGASVDQRGHSGQSILQFAVKGAVRAGSTDILKVVLSWGVSPNVLGNVRFSGLHAAVWTNPGQAAEAEAVIAELLRSGTDPCMVNDRGQRALDIAVNLQRSPAIQKLLADATRVCPRL